MFPRSMGLATSPGLPLSTPPTMASPLLTYWLGWADLIGTHLICPALPLVHLRHPFLLSLHLRILSGRGNILTMGTPRMVNHTLWRALQESQPFWPPGDTCCWILEVAVKGHEHWRDTQSAGYIVHHRSNAVLRGISYIQQI